MVRWTKKRGLMAGMAALFIVGSAVALSGSFSRHHTVPSQISALPTGELEDEVQRRAAIDLRADSQIEEESRQPLQTVLAAKDGDTLVDLLLKAGVDRAEAVKAVEALSEVYDPKALKVGQPVTVTFERPSHGIGSGPFRAVTLQPDPSRQVSANRAEGGFAVRETKRHEIRQLARYSGTIKGSLFESATAEGVPTAILVEMIKAFSYDVDFQRDIQRGDKFEVMFERFVDNHGQTVRDGQIQYANLILSGEAMPIYRYVDAAGRADYYNPKGESVRKALLRTPVDGARISSSFGMRLHPILGFSKMHKGVDFAVASGTPVMAAGSGTIEMAGANGSYGYYVRIRHDARHSTAYAHLSRFAQGIRTGRHVEQGQTIAFSGATGRATGPHLHYEVLVDARQVNPLSVKFQSGNKLAGSELQKFLNNAKGTGALFVQLPISHKVALVRTTGNSTE